MAMPVPVGVGAFVFSAGDITPGFPAGYTVTDNDVAIIYVETESEEVTAPSGWAVLATVAVNSGSSSRLTALWRRLVSTDTAPTITSAANHKVGAMFVASGCKTSGDPWNGVVTDTELTSDTSVSITGLTTTADDCLILAAFSTTRDANVNQASGWANASLAAVAEQLDQWRNVGTGGGLAMATGQLAAAGPTGNTGATVGLASFKALMTIALEGVGATTHQAAGAASTTSSATADLTIPGITHQAAGDATTTSTASAALGILHPAAGTAVTTTTAAADLTIPGSRTPPTYPAAQDLAEGTGTRAFAAVTTQAGDYLVVEAIGEDGGTLTALTPTATGLTFTQQTNAGAGGDVRIQQWTAPDAAGGSRTVTITPNDGASRYRARLTVDRGSGGPGTGKATSLTGQTVSVTRQDANSGMHMAVGDWSAGAVGTPVWTPGGATVASQQGAGATYIIGRWDDSGAAATESHGISSPSYTTPAIAVLEMLGTAGGPVTHQIAGAATTTSAAAAAVTQTGALTGTATTTSTTAADLTRTTPLAGTATTASTAAAALTLRGALSGTATTTSAASGALTRVTPITGGATTTATASGALTIASGAITWPADGTATTTSTASATLTAQLAATGTAVTTTTAAADLRMIPGPVEGAAATTSTASAALGVLALLAGTATTTSSATAAATVVAPYQPAYWSIDSHTSVGAVDTRTTSSGQPN